MNTIFNEASRIYIDQSDDTGTLVWCYSNEIYKDDYQKKTSKFPNGVACHLKNCCILLIDPTKNITKDNERTSLNEPKHNFFYKNISLSFYSRKGHTVCCGFER